MSMENNLEKNAPLADRMRPKTLDDFVGQDHLIGEGKFITRSIEADRITSMIFYGPPGTGKTSLANIIANTTNMNFKKLSAVTAGVKDVRKIIKHAKENLKLYNKRTILFIDEIHRFNKSQQDALLPVVERGIIILIGATTENPYFEVNKALLSRAMVLELKPLDRQSLKKLIERAINDSNVGLGNTNINIRKEAIDYLLNISEGDARNLLNSLEIAVLSTSANRNGVKEIDLEVIENSMIKKIPRYDKDGDDHYNTVSAFIKSMRGSDPDATLYWLAKMLKAGEDPKFIARRITIAASEDVGNADPNALVVANSAFQAIEYIGMPEARMFLSQAALYVATAPKSNSAYKGIDEALSYVEKEKSLEVPYHLRDTHFTGAKKLGHGEGYKYPHNYEKNYVTQNYLPKGVNCKFYQPSDNGYEAKIKDRENN